MSSINTYNYEAWFLDFCEGNLDAHQLKELLAFLDEHPELKKELDDFENSSLNPEEHVFEDKKRLKKKSDIDHLNYETFIIGSIENQLSVAHEDELQAFLETEEAYQKDDQLYRKLKLTPDPQLVFKDKESLKRRRGLVVPLIIRYGTVAAVGVILISLFLWPRKQTVYVTRDIPEFSFFDDQEPIDDNEFFVQEEHVSWKKSPPQKKVSSTKEFETDQREVMSVPDTIMNKQGEFIAEITDTITGIDLVTSLVSDKQSESLKKSEKSINSQSDYMPVVEFVSRQIKKKLLKVNETSDEVIRKEDLFASAGKSLKRISKGKVDYAQSEKEHYKVYSLSVGKFSFVRKKIIEK